MDTPQIDKLTLRRARVRTRGQHLTAKQRIEAQEAFLASYNQGHSITKSCKAAGVSRETLYTWKEHDEPFMLRFNQAKEEGDDVIRDEIYRRGVEGWEEPVYQLKVRVGTVRRYSDQLLERLAKARMPEYRDKQQVEISGQLDINVLAAEADKKLRALLDASTVTSVLE
jgi:hypothetical protein